MYCRYLNLAAVALLPASLLTAAPITEWAYHMPADTEIREEADGVLVLRDDNDRDAPRAIHYTPTDIRSGELRWRARRASGLLSYAVWLGSGSDNVKAWDVAVYTSPEPAIHIRKGAQPEVVAKTIMGTDVYDNKWLDLRLVFDTDAGRAQLYMDDIPSPVAEVTGFTTPVGRIELVCGYSQSTDLVAEFSGVELEEKPVQFLPVVAYEPPPVWPPFNEAPAQMIVEDKFDQFANWWQSASGVENEAAKERLKAALGRESLGLGNEMTDSMRMVPILANRIRWEEPYAGAQQSHRYRSSPNNPSSWDEPANTRLMEPVSILAQFYGMAEPWNPYYRDEALGKRLKLALEYWLRLQAPAGGFPEYAGFGSSELPAVSFGLLAMVQVHEALAGEPFFADFEDRWIDSMGRAVRWADQSLSARRQGVSFANQYVGVLYGAHYLYKLTGEQEWLNLYNELTDWWLAQAQPTGWYREHTNREDFSYSQVSEFIVDQLYKATGDERWNQSLRDAYGSSQLITGFEMDRRTALVDSTPYARTSIGALERTYVGGSSEHMSRASSPTRRTVGRYNAAAARVEEALVFAIDAITPEQAVERRETYFARMPQVLYEQAPNRIYNPYGSWSWDGTGDYTTLAQGSQYEAVGRSKVWAQERFTEVVELPVDLVVFAGVRRPGYYLTLHAGERIGQRNLGAGLLWVPGYGNVFASANNIRRPAFGWAQQGVDLAQIQQSIQLNWKGGTPQQANAVELVTNNKNFPNLQFHLADEELRIDLGKGEHAFYLPLVLRPGDRWIADNGQDLASVNTPLITRRLRLQRQGDKVTHDVLLTFSSPVQLAATNSGASSPLGGDLAVRQLEVRRQAAEPLTISISRK